MRCKDFEQEIYLYAELSQIERAQLDAHIRECAACKALFRLVSSTHELIAKTSTTKPELANHARLTSNIMQVVAKQKSQSASWIDSLFIKYAMIAASLALLAVFGAEQLSPISGYSKRIPVARTVTLNSTVLMKATLDRKENAETKKPSLYACVKSGDCNYTIIENFKKNSF